MQKGLSQPLRKGFARRLRQQFPMFHDVTRECVVPSGMSVHRYDFNPALCFFITLWPSPKSWDDRFTLDIGWSKTGKYPFSTSFSPSDPPRDGALTFRLPRLWVREDRWWWLGKEPTWEDTVAKIDKSFEELQRDRERQFPVQLAAVEPHLDDVFRRLREHAVPYFNRIATDFGYADTPFPEPDSS